VACEGHVAILSGRKQGARLDDPELQALAARSPDLLTCGAVLTDSDVLCNQLVRTQMVNAKMCARMRSIFNELRAYPDKRSFMLDEPEWQECRSVPVLKTSCDALREALRSGDCGRAGDLESICRAYVDLDKSLCRVTGELAEAEFQFPEPKENEPAKVRVKDGLEEGCRRNIESRAFLAKGLEALAQSGTANERELAKAALRRADACDTYAKAALQVCTSAGPPTVP
jgi:hypothetical protein